VSLLQRSATMRCLGLLFLIFMTACGAPPTSTPRANSNAPYHGAYLRALVKIVDVRPNAATNFTAASDGEQVSEQAEVRTGSDSQARLDFGDGAVVRLGQNTWVGITELGAAANSSLTRLDFKAGQLSISLAEGKLAAQTLLGEASVQGSYAVFQYDPGRDPTIQDDVLTVQCIEGACAYYNNSDPVLLGNLQQLIVSNRGQVLTGPTDLPPGALADFLANNPQSTAVLLTLTAARPTATMSPTLTPTTPTPPPTIGLPFATDTATLPASETLTPSASPTHTRRPPAPLPSDTPSPGDTNTPQPPPVPSATDTAKAPPPPRPTATPLPPTALPTQTPTAAPTQLPTIAPPTQTPTRPPPATKTVPAPTST